VGLAIVVALAVGAVVAVVAVGAGQPGASVTVGVGVNGQVIHRFSLLGCDGVRHVDHRLTTVTCRRDKITNSRPPLSRITVTASR
jgi:hypothetical protein